MLAVANIVRSKTCSAFFFACMMMTVFSKAHAELLADNSIRQPGFVVGAQAGYGSVDVNTDEVSKDSYGSFALGFRGGYAVNSYIVTGVEINGWTLKPYNVENPSKGEAVSNVSLFVNYFPVKKYPVYISAGVGYLSYSNNSPEVNGRDSGDSWFVGSGYEIPISDEVALVPQIRYAHGNFTGGDFAVYEATLGLNWYLGK